MAINSQISVILFSLSIELYSGIQTKGKQLSGRPVGKDITTYSLCFRNKRSMQPRGGHVSDNNFVVTEDRSTEFTESFG